MVQGGEEESAGSGRGCHRGRRETRERGALKPREDRVPEVRMSKCWYTKRENYEIWPLDSATWRSLVIWWLDESYFSGAGRIATLTRVGSRESYGSSQSTSPKHPVLCIEPGRPRGMEWGGRREGGFGMGNTCIPVADSFWYLAKLIQLCKV